jgi:adenylate cyclase
MASKAQPTVYRFNGLVLDAANEVLRDSQGQRIPLRARSFGLLRLLVENTGRLLTRETIMETLWPDLHVTEDNITQCAHDVRAALGPDLSSMLRTVRGRGYVFEAPDVTREPGVAAQGLGSGVFGTGEPHIHVAAGHPPAGAARALTETSGAKSGTSIGLSVLMMPLRSLDGSKVGELVAERITADIFTDLARQLPVVAPGHVRILFQDDQPACSGHATTGRGVGREVGYVLRGTVHDPHRPTVNLRLSDAETGACIWADRSELGGPCDEAVRLVRRISRSLVMDASRRVEAVGSDMTADDLVMRGRAWLLYPSSFSRLDRALDCFESAVALEPDSVGARLGIATVLVSYLSNSLSETIARDEARAETLLQDVFDAGTDVALAHCTNGVLRRLQGRPDESLIELETAVRLAPHFAMAESQLGMTHLFAGRPDAALSHFERGARMDPHGPLGSLLLSNLATGRLFMGDIDTAVDRLRVAATGAPRHAPTLLAIAGALGLRSASPESGDFLRRAISLCPAFGSLSGLRAWLARQAAPSFMFAYESTLEHGLRRAGMVEE